MSDVIVVGAGPAGAATAIFLAERGLDVLVLDRAVFPRPKLCGEYLSPEAARLLDRLGVLKALDVAGAVPLGGMRITAPDGTVVVGRYRPVDGWRPYRDHALAIPRETPPTHPHRHAKSSANQPAAYPHSELNHPQRLELQKGMLSQFQSVSMQPLRPGEHFAIHRPNGRRWQLRGSKEESGPG